MIINSKVAFLAHSSPEGLLKTRSAPYSASESIMKPRSSRRDPQLRNIFGTRTEWHHLFCSFAFLFVCARLVSIFFLKLPKCRLCACYKTTLTSWWKAPGSVAGHFSSCSFSPSNSSVISYPQLELNDIIQRFFSPPKLHSCLWCTDDGALLAKD